MTGVTGAELQKRADRADQSVLFFLAGANFWEKHAKNRRKHAKTRENRRKTGAFLALIFLGEKLVGANFYAFCNYGNMKTLVEKKTSSKKIKASPKAYCTKH